MGRRSLLYFLLLIMVSPHAGTHSLLCRGLSRIAHITFGLCLPGSYVLPFFIAVSRSISVDLRTYRLRLWVQ